LGALSERGAGNLCRLILFLGEKLHQQLADGANGYVHHRSWFVLCKAVAVGELQQISSVVTPQVVAAEYHACFLAAGLTNSYVHHRSWFVLCKAVLSHVRHSLLV
jgi:hypothetical protein